MSASDLYNGIVGDHNFNPEGDLSGPVADPEHAPAPHETTISPADVIDAWGLDYWSGSVLVNLLRAANSTADRQGALDKAAESAMRAADVNRKRT